MPTTNGNPFNKFNGFDSAKHAAAWNDAGRPARNRISVNVGNAEPMRINKIIITRKDAAILQGRALLVSMVTTTIAGLFFGVNGFRVAVAFWLFVGTGLAFGWFSKNYEYLDTEIKK